MKRDLDLCRDILVAVEGGSATLKDLVGEDWTAYQINYHVKIMQQGGLLDAQIAPSQKPGGPPASVFVRSLTWEGHDFLDAVRDHEIWAQVKTKALEPVGSWTFDLVKEVVKSYIKLKVKDVTGLDL